MRSKKKKLEKAEAEGDVDMEEDEVCCDFFSPLPSSLLFSFPSFVLASVLTTRMYLLVLQPAPKPQTTSRSAYDDVLYGSDSDVSGTDDDERVSAPTKTQNRKTQTKKNKAKEAGAFLHEDDHEVLDLLDDKMMSRISGGSFHSFYSSATRGTDCCSMMISRSTDE